MVKVFSRKVLSTVVASSLIFGVGSAVVTAAPKTVTKQTALTVQNARTGVIKVNDVTVPRYAKEIQLSGTVEIDGPQLVVTILGPGDKTVNATVKEVGGKLWTYTTVVDVSAIKGDATFDISAHTIYIGGGPNAGKTHTTAPTVSQTIHVPYIKSTVAEKTNWAAYDRSNNEFTLLYDEVENWSVGDPVVRAKSLVVSGLKDNVTILDKKLTVPTANQDFKFSPQATWVFNAAAKTYSATFNVYITDSKGFDRTESVTKTDLTAGRMHTFTHSVADRFGTIWKTVSYMAPEAPVSEVEVGLKNLKLILVEQNKNQFKVNASYELNGTTKKENLSGNFGNPNPKSKSNNPSTRDVKIAGIDYTVTVHYNASNDSYHVTYKLKN
ncbi:hypothetical protein [Sporosarcina sp. UB5]|uniref:hypothetical protein n=1 Tax=Sporosarcina sp. UB5 TaxID=3047463 RepID=UPI003D7B585A